jgi:hypothetical protein
MVPAARHPARGGRVVRAHLDRHGFGMVEVRPGHLMNATRTDPDSAWVRFALDSLARTDGTPPALLPNLGGSLPNEAFADELGLPTIWIPHSYPACARTAPRSETGAPSSVTSGGHQYCVVALELPVTEPAISGRSKTDWTAIRPGPSRVSQIDLACQRAELNQ